jgi:hypothetical protein
VILFSPKNPVLKTQDILWQKMATQTPKPRPATTGPVPSVPMGTPTTAPLSTGAAVNTPTGGVSGQSMQNDGAGAGTINVSGEEWESERQLVASLAMLQELEAKVRCFPSLLSRVWFVNTSFRSTSFEASSQSVF